MNKLLNIPGTLSLIFVLSIFNGGAQEYYYTECDSFEINKNFTVTEQDEHEFVHSYAERTFVYCSPDTIQEPIGFVNFNTTLTTLETVSHVRRDSFAMYSNRPNEYQYKNHFFVWKKISFRKGFGFVKKTDLADEYYEEGPFLLKRNSGRDRYDNQLKAISTEPNSRGSLDKINLRLMHGYRIRICPQNGLANSGLLIAYETYRESCPGASITSLIILNEDGFNKVISNSSGGEGGMFDSETVYFPLKLDDGSIRLIAEGYIIRSHMDADKVNLKEISGFPYPKNIGVPIDRLIVKTRSYTENILDENGMELMDENSSYRVKVIHDEPIFYEWNGVELFELGSNYYMDRLDSLVDIQTNSLIEPKTTKMTQKPTKTDDNSIKTTNKDTNVSLKGGIIGFILGAFLVIIAVIWKRRMAY